MQGDRAKARCSENLSVGLCALVHGGVALRGITYHKASLKTGVSLSLWTSRGGACFFHACPRPPGDTALIWTPLHCRPDSTCQSTSWTWEFQGPNFKKKTKGNDVVHLIYFAGHYRFIKERTLAHQHSRKALISEQRTALLMTILDE